MPISPAMTRIVVEAKKVALRIEWPIRVASTIRLSRLSSRRIHASRTATILALMLFGRSSRPSNSVL